MTAIKILALSTLFPNPEQPRHGIFLKHRLSHLAHLGGGDIRVVAPIPYFPSKCGVFGRYASYARVPANEEYDEYRVSHPRFLSIPKIGMTVSPTLLAASLVSHLSKLKRGGFDFDIIDAYYLYPDGVAAMALGLLFRRPVVLTALGSDVSLLPKYRLPRAAIVWAARQSNHLTAVCEALKDGLVGIGVAPETVRVIVHGVDLALFRRAEDRTTLRKRLGFDGPTLVSVGHLIPRKGHDIAIEAMTRLPGHRLIIVGDGPEERRLRRRVQELHLQDVVSFYGHVPQAELSPILAAADLLVNCSDREGIANVLLEAMACGTPVAATAVWGSPELVSVPEAGLLLRERSASSLVEAVQQLFANPPDRAMTRRYAERFSWRDTAVQHMETIDSAIEAWKRHAPDLHRRPH